MIELGPFTAGEVPFPLVHQFLDADGSAIDLTGFSVQCQWKRQGDSEATERAATLTDADDGKATHTWADGDLAAGAYRAVMWAGNGTNRVASDDFYFYVVPTTGDTPDI